MKLLFVALVVLSVAGSQAANLCTSSATYKVDISCKWTEERHPKDYPADNPPHFTVMCGTAHNSNYTLWSVGSIATLGLKEAAELGYCSMLEDEINDCTKEGSCATNGFFDWHCNPTLGNVCTFKGKVTVTPEYQSVSMMSMMVPSPDWAVGLDSINLCRMDENGDFVWMNRYPAKGRVAIYPFDAGTDGGKSFFSPDVPLDPFVPIKLLNVEDSSNIFYNEKEEKLYPVCTARILRKK